MTREQIREAFDTAELLIAQEEMVRVADEPPYHFSVGFERRMDRVCRRMEQGKSPVLSKTVRTLLIAAIIAALLAAAVGAVMIVDYRFNWFSDHVEYNQPEANTGVEMTPIVIEYVPNGYQLGSGEDTVLSSTRSYLKGEDWLDIEKHPANGAHGADNEGTDIYEIVRNGVKYTIFRTEPEGDNIGIYSVFWADRDFRYTIYASENFSDDELLRIAEGVS